MSHQKAFVCCSDWVPSSNPKMIRAYKWKVLFSLISCLIQEINCQTQVMQTKLPNDAKNIHFLCSSSPSMGLCPFRAQWLWLAITLGTVCLFIKLPTSNHTASSGTFLSSFGLQYILWVLHLIRLMETLISITKIFYSYKLIALFSHQSIFPDISLHYVIFSIKKVCVCVLFIKRAPLVKSKNFFFF